jgi:hypothetical protein
MFKATFGSSNMIISILFHQIEANNLGPWLNIK